MVKTEDSTCGTVIDGRFSTNLWGKSAEAVWSNLFVARRCQSVVSPAVGRPVQLPSLKAGFFFRDPNDGGKATIVRNSKLYRLENP